jgi:hypothetical protein
VSRYQRCATEGCDLLSLSDPHCVAHRTYSAGCESCGWVEMGDDCVCPSTASEPECHCVELQLMSAPGGPWRCEAGSAVMLG